MRVLIVEDSPDYFTLLQRYLSRELVGVEALGYFPSNHDRVVPRVSDHSADVILLDYQLGSGIDGLQWLQALRAQDDCPPVIFMTAHGDEYVAVMAMKRGAIDYVNKRDLDSGRLAELIRGAVVRHDNLDWTLDAGDGVPKEPPAGGPRRESGLHGEDDGYRFLRPIGAGAMSKVYLAERVHDGLTVALKLMSLKNLPTDEVKHRFLREAELASSIESPYVVKVHDFGLTPTYGYLAMELFTRGDLKQRLNRPASWEDALVYLWNIAEGLAVIHSKGVLHRDLKPDNIMFRSDDSMAIADFGISKRIVEPGLMTTLGKVLGSPHYMSPEQGQGMPVDPRSDLYALGVILYQMLAGRPPFNAPNPVALIHLHVTAPVPRLPRKVRHLQPLVDRLLAKDPMERLPDAKSLADELRGHMP